MHETCPPTNRDTIGFQLSALQPHMIRSVVKVRHRQWDMPGTNVDEYLGYLFFAMYY
jgi:hypothetical protein